MLESIQNLLADKKYQDALDFIVKNISHFNSQPLNDCDVDEYTALLKYRVTVRTLLGIDDEVILSSVRSKRFPHEYRCVIGGKCEIALTYADLFQVPADAYVNSVHVDKLFGLSGMSASSEFINRIGADSVKKQLRKNIAYQLGDVIRLKHPNLTAPLSYHIVLYENDDSAVNDDALRKGLVTILDDAIKNKVHKLSFFPIGMNAVIHAKPEVKQQTAEHICDIIAQQIASYASTTKTKHIPQIQFFFINPLTFETYKSSFYHCSRQIWR
jgi:hypothetical protein